MNNTSFQRLGATVLLCTTLMTNTACVNEIDTDIQVGTVPIRFSTQVKPTSTRATDTTFEKGDVIGLFATVSSGSIAQKRYIDNLRLECSTSSTLIPEKDVFYPEGDATLDFTGYYPFQANGIEPDCTSIPITIQTNQSDAKKRTASDFLIATAAAQKSSEKAIELKFKHKLAKLKITLTPEAGEKADDMLKADLRIIATGFKTQAMYNLETDEFTDLQTEADIIPYGAWNVNSEGDLEGKEFIVIPQTAEENLQSFIIEWNGKIYTCPTPKLSIAEGSQCEINIAALQSTSHLLTGIVGSIENWTEGAGGQTNNEYNISAIHIAALSFKQSDVYRVYREGNAVAEICKEYLLSSHQEIASQAVVVYPVWGEQADLTQGTVLQLANQKENIHGGFIGWDLGTNTFVYTPGNAAPIDKFYIDTNNKITLSPPATPQAVNVIGHTIRDIRNGELQTYPIVKIGTQYWMKEDLHATLYRNGTPIKLQTKLGQGAGYFRPTSQACYFYNGEALLAQSISPTGWKVPNENEWELLNSYIQKQASMVKWGTWRPTTIGGNTAPTSNETGLNISPNGLYIEKADVTNLINAGVSAAYWIEGTTQDTLSEKAMLFMSTSDSLQLGANKPANKSYYQAFSIRCIKE